MLGFMHPFCLKQDFDDVVIVRPNSQPVLHGGIGPLVTLLAGSVSVSCREACAPFTLPVFQSQRFVCCSYFTKQELRELLCCLDNVSPSQWFVCCSYFTKQELHELSVLFR